MTTNQFFQYVVTTCNEDVVSHYKNNKVMIDPEKENTPKDSFRNSPINSDTKKYYNVSPIPLSLENSIPDEVSTLHKETHNDQSHVYLSRIDFGLDMKYWLNFSLEDMKTLDDVFFYHPPPSTYFEGNT